MAIVTFRDFCLDASEEKLVAEFWSAVLGQPYLPEHQVLDAAEKTRRIWVNEVPEPKTGKNRVHLDVRMPEPDPAPLVELGAKILREPTETDKWWQLADPDGNEFCAFPPAPFHDPDHYEPFEMVVDSADPAAQARWWAGVLGGTAGEREGVAFRWVEGIETFPLRYLVFTPVPEPKTVKNRLHWDVNLPPGKDSSVLVEAGATVIREPDDEIRWTIMADPEGNEFCAFTAE